MTHSPLQSILDRLLEKKARYDSLKPFPERMQESFHAASRIELTYHSNAIEGNTLTLAETALVINEQIAIPGKKLREIYEARNHDRALSYVEKIVRDGKMIDENDILHIHQIVLTDIDDLYAGRYRDMPVRISGSTVVLPNPLKVPILMEEFSGALQTKYDNTLIFSAMKKYEFLAIHPFIDGNGRTSRLLWNYFLLRDGYPLAYIDIADRPVYMDSLQKMDSGNTEGYLILMLRAVERSLDLFLESLAK